MIARELLWLGVLGGLIACGGGSSSSTGPTDVPIAEVVSPTLLAKTWPVRLANNETRQGFEEDRGWQHLFERNYPGAMAAFVDTKNAVGMARMHFEYGVLYRQAALLGANATIQAYQTDAQDYDPDEMGFFIAVSQAMLGRPTDAVAGMEKVPDNPNLADRVTGWSQLFDKKTTIPQDLKSTVALMGGLPPVTLGTLPKSPSLPHFQFTEKTSQARLLGVNDPVAMLAIARWHDAAVLLAKAELSAAALSALRAPWALPSEALPEVGEFTLGDEWLFGRVLLCAEDVRFVADLRARGAPALADWDTRSPLAAAIAPAWDGQKLIPQKVMDQSLGLMRQTQAAMASSAGEQAGFHRPFAMFARLGVLFAGQVLADAADQYRDAGILRLEALERMAGGAGGVQRDPVFALSVAAWDAGNRNPQRPEDIVHDLVKEFPDIEAVRAPLDALHLRRSRNAAPSSPVH
jgi:hypothetical protein